MYTIPASTKAKRRRCHTTAVTRSPAWPEETKQTTSMAQTPTAGSTSGVRGQRDLQYLTILLLLSTAAELSDYNKYCRTWTRVQRTATRIRT